MSEALFCLPLPHGISAKLFRLPIWFYRFKLGGVLGDRFLLINHIGRKTGKPHQTVVEIVRHDKPNRIYYVVSGWGEQSNWYKNILANPLVTIQVGNHRYRAVARRVSAEVGAQVILHYAREHPIALRMISRIMKYPMDGSEDSASTFGKKIPIIAFQITEPIY